MSSLGAATASQQSHRKEVDRLRLQRRRIALLGMGATISWGVRHRTNNPRLHLRTDKRSFVQTNQQILPPQRQTRAIEDVIADGSAQP